MKFDIRNIFIIIWLVQLLYSVVYTIYGNMIETIYENFHRDYKIMSVFSIISTIIYFYNMYG